MRNFNKSPVYRSKMLPENSYSKTDIAMATVAYILGEGGAHFAETFRREISFSSF